MKLNFNKLQLYKDNYNIYNLITKINYGYRLYHCQEESCFYIINIANNNEICMKFTNFNDEILKKLQISRIENIQKIFRQIDIDNENLTNNLHKNMKQKFDDSLAELHWLCKRTNQLSSLQIDKIIEENNA